MLQAVGVTSVRGAEGRPAVDDISFDCRPGEITALLGERGAGKTTLVRLVAGLDAGRGMTWFRGTPLHRVADPAREVGLVLGGTPGHPARTAGGHLRMLSAAAGVPAARADELLDEVGLGALRDERLGLLSRGMDRRLALAAALLGDPHTLILDEPCRDLSLRDAAWLLGRLRVHADAGGTVLCTSRDPKEAARFADHVVTLDGGRVVADQDAESFARTRLRPRVSVRTPHAARLSDAVRREARAARRSLEVVTESSSLLSVYGSSCPEIGETAFRHGVLVHRLTEEVGAAPAEPGGMTGGPGGTTGGPSGLVRPAGPGRGLVAAARRPPAEAVAVAREEASSGDPADALQAADGAPVMSPARPRSPRRALRYELRRMLGVRTAPLIAAAVVVSSLALCVLLARGGGAPRPAALVAWPGFLPLPPAAFGAGLIGALSFGEEFRFPALAAVRGVSPRRPGLLLAKLAVTAAAAVVLALLAVVADAQVLRLVNGADLGPLRANWADLGVRWLGLCIGCAWAGLLAAAVFRVTAAGVAAVLAVPVLIAPLVEFALLGPAVRSIAGLPGRLRSAAGSRLPEAADPWIRAALELLAQPVGAAMVLSLSALICAYLSIALRSRTTW
ncbi:ATP-binding cassette domain-containing protein [Streptomyces genisteinicus]|uniref:ATP-binding cassette domain-containing protein n=1 Tax=Streptomyces genisteinicus TaxID=2768068 RepID=A0A7H0I447_9ACTN|nr:ATP-binding cassette domain-containing protein [Streptomyces genisteinicus]QNP67563.1 ATP-binding cassette domain-containing protein [Streptomyces genisteinicus]